MAPKNFEKKKGPIKRDRARGSQVHTYDDVEDDVERLEIFDGMRKDDDYDGENEEEIFHNDYYDNNDAGDDDDEDDDHDDDDNSIMNLVENLPSKLRQKILTGDINHDDDDDDDDGLNNKVESSQRWGKKSTFWTGDTADLEIGQDIEDAEDEERAAKDLEKQRIGRMRESDFFDERSNHFQSTATNKKIKSATFKSKNISSHLLGIESLDTSYSGAGEEISLGHIESLSLGRSNGATHVEKLIRDTSQLSSEEKLAMVSAEAPELPGLVADMQERLAELRNKITPLWKLVNESAERRAKVHDDVADYLDVKQQLLLAYCMDITFYLYLKSQGRSVKGHPVMKQLLELRYAMEKMRPLDAKLQHQIDRLVKLASADPESQELKTALLRPNFSALVTDEDEENDDDDREVQNNDDDDDDNNGQGVDEDMSEIEDDIAGDSSFLDNTSKQQQLYRAPKMIASHYKESEREEDKRANRLDKKKRRAAASEIMEALRDEFGVTPENTSSTGVGANPAQKQLAEEAEERRRFEEERFVRLTLSRKDKQSMKRRSKEALNLQNIEDVGDIGDFDNIAKLTELSDKTSHTDDISFNTKTSVSSRSIHDVVKNGAESLQQAVHAFVQSTTGKSKRVNNQIRSDDLMAEIAEPNKFKYHETEQVDDDEDGENDGAASNNGDNSNSRRERQRAPNGPMNFNDQNDSEGGDNLLDDFARKKKEFIKAKKSHYSIEPKYAGKDEEMKGVSEEDQQRGITYEIMKNKGFTPYRKTENKNPRVKKRKAFEKAVVARKGQIREVVTGKAGSYGGETSGIKSNLSRSRKF